MRTVTQGPSLSGFWGQAKTPGQGQAPPWVGVVETEGVYTHSGVMCPYLTRLSYRTAFQQQPGSFVELLVRSPTRVFLRSRGSCPAEPPSTSHRRHPVLPGSRGRWRKTAEVSTNMAWPTSKTWCSAKTKSTQHILYDYLHKI